MVKRKIDDVNYEIDMGRKKSTVYHVNILRAWVDRHSYCAQLLEQDSIGQSERKLLTKISKRHIHLVDMKHGIRLRYQRI